MATERRVTPIRVAIVLAVTGLAVVSCLTARGGGTGYREMPNQGIHGAQTARKVLFVGNSHMIVGQVPYLVQQLVPKGEPPLEFEALLYPGVTFRWHSDAGDVRTLTRKYAFDAVVIQPQSQELTLNSAAAVRDARALAAEANGARTVLFQTWPREKSRDPQAYGPGHPTSMDHWATLGLQTARDTGLPVAPVGSVFLCVYAATRIDLWSRDGNHANDAGAYVAALTLLGTLYTTDVAEAQWRPDGVPEQIAPRLREATAKCLAATREN